MPDATRPDVDLTGSCACGAVTVAVRGQVLSMLMCACDDCQKASGTGHSVLFLTPAEAVVITGETRAYTRPAASGATFTRRFCPTCGTPLGGQSSRATGLMALPIGLFGSATDWYRPTRLIFARSHRDWDHIDPAVLRHDTYPERGA